mmetsp:Transcript_829/g.1463  ORF Transcript_829/g.1463 Transcript_829/m.1463 type:complete len:321 (-) Transcript_829:51-1013(-)
MAFCWRHATTLFYFLLLTVSLHAFQAPATSRLRNPLASSLASLGDPEATNESLAPPTGTTKDLPIMGRGQFLQVATTASVAVGASLGSLSRPAAAEGEGAEAPSAALPRPEVTDRAFLDVSLNGEPLGRLVLGLYGKEAPATVRNFLAVAQKEYQGDISYDFSTVFKIEKDVCVDFGRVAKGMASRNVRTIDNIGKIRTTTVSTAEDTANADHNRLPHDRAGLLTAQRGGGTFEFGVTAAAPAPGARASLDARNLVFGEVLEGYGEVIAALNAVPTTQDDFLGTKAGFAGAGKGFDPRAKLAYVGRPLAKIVVTRAGRLP